MNNVTLNKSNNNTINNGVRYLSEQLTSIKTVNKQDALIQELAELLGSQDNAHIWLNSPHPFLGDQTPQSYLDREELWEIEYLVHAIGTGQPS